MSIFFWGRLTAPKRSKNIDFVAISGKSGSGKSTLMDILTGMLTPTKGSFLINNTEIGKATDIDMKWWQKKCAYIPQDVFLINSSKRVI